MKKNYRITGMVICLMLMILAASLMATGNKLNIDLAVFLTMFVAGYGLRETLDHIGENNNTKVKE